jgi:hypothetical protein
MFLKQKNHFQILRKGIIIKLMKIMKKKGQKFHEDCVPYSHAIIKS